MGLPCTHTAVKSLETDLKTVGLLQSFFLFFYVYRNVLVKIVVVHKTGVTSMIQENEFRICLFLLLEQDRV